MFKVLAVLLLLGGSAFAQSQQQGAQTCDQQAIISVSNAGLTPIATSYGRVMHICQVVFSTSSPVNIDFDAIQGGTPTVLSGNVAISSYSWNWHGELTTRAGGLGASFGFNLSAAVTVRGSMTYYIADN